PARLARGNCRTRAFRSRGPMDAAPKSHRRFQISSCYLPHYGLRLIILLTVRGAHVADYFRLALAQFDAKGKSGQPLMDAEPGQGNRPTGNRLKACPTHTGQIPSAPYQTPSQ